jgi:hypothetical protein
VQWLNSFVAVANNFFFLSCSNYSGTTVSFAAEHLRVCVTAWLDSFGVSKEHNIKHTTYVSK